MTLPAQSTLFREKSGLAHSMSIGSESPPPHWTGGIARARTFILARPYWVWEV